MFIGAKIHNLRKERRMKLIELAEASGVQLATLSRIENMKMVGTLESHIKIAKALGIDVTELYKDIDKEPKLVEYSDAQARTDVFTHSEHSSYEILTKNILHKKMMPVLIRIDPHGKTNKEQDRPGTEKFLFILEGSVEVLVAEEKFSLSKGSTLYFDATLPHTFINKGKGAAKLLCVGTPVSL